MSNHFTLLKQFGATLFYGLSSILIMIVIKTVLSVYKFPSFQVVGLGQVVATLVALQVLKLSGIVAFPHFSLAPIVKVFPLPLFFFGNLLFGLGGTKKLSLPMFTVLRRFTLLFTLIGETALLRKPSSSGVKLSILIMIAGAVIAAKNDLSFEFWGYLFVLLNNLCTTSNALYVKKMLNNDELGKYGILYYNNLVVILPSCLISWGSGDIEKAYYFDQWKNPTFLFFFLFSCFMGLVLNYATILCTAVTSPLTTMVTGCVKNIVITYVGMSLGSDYQYSLQNFVGINMSVLGSVIYSVVKYNEQASLSSSEDQQKKVNGKSPTKEVTYKPSNV